MNALTTLQAGMVIPFGGNRYTTVTPELAEAFKPGDHLHIVQDSGALLHIPAAVHELVSDEISAAVDAAVTLRSLASRHVAAFYRHFADALADDDIWRAIESANTEDINRAHELGRSTTRLEVSEKMRQEMVEGLRTWEEYVDGSADATDVVSRVDHGTWQVDIVTAPLGVIGFVFEGRPNVFADAAGVIATGNAAVLRIGGDALTTAAAIDQYALRPALAASGLPTAALRLIPSRERSAGWALFADRRLALAVARGSGPAVAQLGSIARQSGVPLSAHGTGGAWAIVDADVDADRLAKIVEHSLDRKVCNTLNVAVLPASRAAELAPVVLAAADAAAAKRSGIARIHVTESAQAFVTDEEFTRQIEVHRADGVQLEPRASLLPQGDLGTEWEWENTPELTITVANDLDSAVDFFNTYSPQFVASIITEDADTRSSLRTRLNAPFIGDGFTRWVDGQYALVQPELGLSNWENGRLLGRGGILTGADLVSRQTIATTPDPNQHR